MTMACVLNFSEKSCKNLVDFVLDKSKCRLFAGFTQIQCSNLLVAKVMVLHVIKLGYRLFNSSFLLLFCYLLYPAIYDDKVIKMSTTKYIEYFNTNHSCLSNYNVENLLQLYRNVCFVTVYGL